MRYHSMEQAAGQLLAGMLENAQISVDESGCFASAFGSTHVTGRLGAISVEPNGENTALYRGFLTLMRVIYDIKRGEVGEVLTRVLKALLADESLAEADISGVIGEILIHAVKSGYIGRIAAADTVAELDDPRMTAEFLHETQGIDDKEDLTL